ncbi:MAG: ribbon-helix-helix domain-containing protein [Albidovulum sp.]|uniref:ribbon-helix-helix domain-containing protein n=1 Tax=Albidovulum sp. TaxID=1872424 RepID=UPI003CA00F04
MSRPVKHSLTLNGHRTSVSLEDEFWRAFREIAEDRDVAINALAAEIDGERGTETGLATAIRLFVLKEYQRRLSALKGR